MRDSLLEKRSYIILNQVNDYNFVGNIIPHSWYKGITLEKGSPDMTAITILAEICYWYRWQYIEDPHTGEIIGKKAKFNADLLQRTIESLQQKFGFSKRSITDAISRLEKVKLLFRELRTIKTKHGNYGNVLFLAPRMKNIIKLDKSIPLTQKSTQGYVKNESTTENQGVQDPSRKNQHKVMSKFARAYAENCVTYTKITTKNSTKNKAAAANNLSQELECGNNGEPIKAAAAVFKETKNIPAQEPKANNFGENEAACKKYPVILHADDYLIRSELSDNQADRIAEQVGELCKKLIGSGVDKSQLRDQYFGGKDFTAVCGILGSVILDKTKFTRCKSHFPKKLSAILGEIERGNFCSLVADVEKQHSFSDAQAPMSKPIEPSEAQVLQRRIASIKCELNSHMQSLKTPIAQDINFAQATNERIAELQTELEQQRNLLEDLESVYQQGNDAALLSNNIKRLNGSAC